MGYSSLISAVRWMARQARGVLVGHGRLLGATLSGMSLLFYGAGRAWADGAASAVFVRFDSDRTLVVSPRAQVKKRVGETEVAATYAADIWTSASIDIRTSASKVPVTEQRDEFDLSVSHELSDVTLSASYRNSSEPDYQSHGGTVGLTYDFAQNNATLALGASGNEVGS